VRYWPYPITGLLLLAGASLVAALYGIVRLRMGVFQHWPYGLGVLLVLIGLGAIVTYANRPPFLTAPARPAAVGTIDDFEDYVHRLIASGDPPGVSVVVVKDGTVVYAKGFGRADGPRDVAATPDTVYRWWSVTKVFTAVATLQLNEKGLLDLDDPVRRHLPFFDVEYPTAARLGPVRSSLVPPLRLKDRPPITIRHLLTHTSGLPDAGPEILGWIHYDGDPPADQTELLKRTLPAYRKLVAEPGREGRYTNIGYLVLAAVIESAAGQRYEDYVTEHVLRPLGMSRTGFTYPPDLRATEATGSHPVDLMTVPASFALDLSRAVRERAQGRLWFNHVYPDQTGPSGLLGSPRDMARFMVALLRDGEVGGARILAPATVRSMNRRYVDATRSPAPVPGVGFGLGWFHLDEAGRVSLSHGGQGTGFASMVRLYPDENLGIAVVANSTYLGRNFGLDLVDLLGAIPWRLASAIDNP
jgi:CubicO group peptidase (beta-lactamase class C family)